MYLSFVGAFVGALIGAMMGVKILEKERTAVTLLLGDQFMRSGFCYRDGMLDARRSPLPSLAS